TRSGTEKDRGCTVLRDRRIVIWLSAIALIPAAVSCGGSDSDVEEVGNAFEAYQSALTTTDGEKAAESVSSATIQLYQEHSDLSISGDPETVQNLSMINRMQVLLIRHRVAPASLKAMDGREVFAHAVNNEWIGKDSVVRVGIDDVAITGNRATAKVTKGGKRTGETFHFVKEHGRWKLDLTPTFRAADQLFQEAARRRGMSENEFIFSVITSLSGRQVTDEIWQPLE
ncbi:MAG: hypothetical protein KY476_05940, partial [Planctomycetes bacterium]|nr:hypothetical protein [Planctomycetota bacterium]